MSQKSSVARISRRIFIIRNRRVMLDVDLAEIYGVSTKRLNEQVRRNLQRFPGDFMFQLTPQESASMRSHFATASKRNIRFQPYAFTEHGVIMLASVLNSTTAINASVYVVRAFIRLRKILSSHEGLSKRLNILEKRYDGQFKVVFDAIQELTAPPDERRKKIGFKP
ncbi:MAG: DNA-binding protein [Elusimicrobia bacterium]|nr:MAG: DNA-binding protein [Elusimicrobiota bacterium]